MPQVKQSWSTFKPSKTIKTQTAFHLYSDTFICIIISRCYSCAPLFNVFNDLDLLLDTYHYSSIAFSYMLLHIIRTSLIYLANHIFCPLNGSITSFLRYKTVLRVYSKSIPNCTTCLLKKYPSNQNNWYGIAIWSVYE